VRRHRKKPDGWFVSVRCMVCHRLIGGYVPKDGDGSLWRAKRHTESKGVVCPGAYRDAVLVS